MLNATSSGVITNDAINSSALCWLTMPDYHVGVMNHEKTVLVILCQDHEVVILCDDNNFSKWITKIFCDHVDINL